MSEISLSGSAEAHTTKFFEKLVDAKKELLSVDELARLLQVSPKTVYGWTYRKLIPFVKAGPRLIRFERTEIERWMLQQKE